MRDIMTRLSEATILNGWELVYGPVQDVTGDSCHDIPEEYGAHDLVDSTPADPTDEHTRNILTFMNPEKTTKIVMHPAYDGRNGEYYSICVYKLIA